MKNSTYIIVTDKGTKHLLPVENILHVASARMYSIFYMRALSPSKGSEQYVSSRNLGSVYHELNNENFLRVHKSHIVNLNEIKSCQLARGAKIILNDNTVINVSQRKKTELLKHLYQLNKKVKYEKQQIKNDPRATMKIHP